MFRGLFSVRKSILSGFLSGRHVPFADTNPRSQPSTSTSPKLCKPARVGKARSTAKILPNRITHRPASISAMMPTTRFALDAIAKVMLPSAGNCSHGLLEVCRFHHDRTICFKISLISGRLWDGAFQISCPRTPIRTVNSMHRYPQRCQPTTPRAFAVLRLMTRSRPIFDRAAIGARGGDGHRLALRDLAQRLVDKISGALQVLDPRRGLVVDAALVDERSFAVDHVHMRGGARSE